MSSSSYVPMTARQPADAPTVRVPTRQPERCDHATSVCATAACVDGWRRTHEVNLERTAPGRAIAAAIGPANLPDPGQHHPGELEQWDYARIADHIGAKQTTVRKYAAEGRLPEPAGRIGQSPYWYASTIRTWHANRPGRGGGGGRPRRQEATA